MTAARSAFVPIAPACLRAGSSRRLPMRFAAMLCVAVLPGFALAAIGCASHAGDSSGRNRSAQRERPLDGESFSVVLRPQGQEPMKDRLTFEDGVFESSVCTNAGFPKSPYTTRPLADGVAF